MKTITEKLPEFGIELLSHALNPTDRAYVPLMVTKYRRYKFATYDQAEEFLKEMTRLQPHLTLRVAPIEGR